MKIIGTNLGRNVYWMTLKKKFYEKSTEEKWGPKDPNKGFIICLGEYYFSVPPLVTPIVLYRKVSFCYAYYQGHLLPT